VSSRSVYWNGSIVRAEDAHVSVFDAGFLYGDGIYETLRAYSGRPFAWDRHVARLARSARAVSLSLPAMDALRAGVEDTITANGTPQVVARITITRGSLGRRLDLSSAGEPSVLVTTDPIDPSADAERRLGVRVIYSKYLRFSAATVRSPRERPVAHRRVSGRPSARTRPGRAVRGAWVTGPGRTGPPRTGRRR